MLFRTKLSLFLSLACLSFIVCAGWLYYIINNDLFLREARQRNLQYARHLSHDLRGIFQNEIARAKTLAQDSLLRSALEDSNDVFMAMDGQSRDQDIKALNQQWMEAKSAESAFIKRYTTNPVAQLLKKIQQTFPGHYGEIFLTNRYGVLVASTGKLTTLAHGHKYWWQSAYDQGRGRTFIDDRGFDESVGGYVLGIVLPVISGGNVLGILKCNVNILSGLKEVIQSPLNNPSTDVRIARMTGQVVLEDGHPPLSTSLGPALMDKLKAVQGKSGLALNSQDKVHAVSPVPFTQSGQAYQFGQEVRSIDHSKGNPGSAWLIAVSESKARILSGLHDSMGTIAIGGLMLSGLILCVSLALGSRITAPLASLAEKARRIGTGRFDVTFDEAKRSDEIGRLATAFADMTADLQRTTARRDQLQMEIKKRHQVEYELVQAKESAEAANLAKSEFLANMSHEIRTPLNGIMGMLQILLDMPLNQEQREFADIALVSSRNLLSLINDVLDLSRVEAGKLVVDEEDFELELLLATVSETVRPQVEEKSNTLSLNIDPMVPKAVRGDPARLRQILFNLVGNAAKFTTRGAISIDVHPLQMATSQGEPRLPYCTMDPDQITLLFGVSDTGRGIPADKQDEIFQPFAQAEDHHASKQSGTGLGLAIVKRLVEVLGGSLSMASTEGEGTAVFFCLPFERVKDDHVEKIKPFEGHEEDAADGCRILIAEDDETSRRTLQLMLQKQGHSVQCVENGRDVLEILVQDKFDCILMDIQMPILDGVETTKHIRNTDSDFRHTPIIALTAFAMSGDRERFLDAGMDDYIAKPVNHQELIKAITKNTCGFLA